MYIMVKKYSCTGTEFVRQADDDDNLVGLDLSAFPSELYNVVTTDFEIKKLK